MHPKRILRLDTWRWRESKLGNKRRLPSSDERALALPKKERNILFFFPFGGISTPAAHPAPSLKNKKTA
jgi:hypothetical protein